MAALVTVARQCGIVSEQEVHRRSGLSGLRGSRSTRMPPKATE